MQNFSRSRAKSIRSERRNAWIMGGALNVETKRFRFFDRKGRACAGVAGYTIQVTTVVQYAPCG
jgi:hypothetical protein